MSGQFAAARGGATSSHFSRVWRVMLMIHRDMRNARNWRVARMWPTQKINEEKTTNKDRVVTGSKVREIWSCTNSLWSKMFVSSPE